MGLCPCTVLLGPSLLSDPVHGFPTSSFFTVCMGRTGGVGVGGRSVGWGGLAPPLFVLVVPSGSLGTPGCYLRPLSRQRRRAEGSRLPHGVVCAGGFAVSGLVFSSFGSGSYFLSYLCVRVRGIGGGRDLWGTAECVCQAKLFPSLL